MTAKLPILGGTVVCPRWGAIDADRCLLCPDLVSLSADGDGYVRCDAGDPLAGPGRRRFGR